MTKLSVVIPTYNRRALVAHAIESVLQQQTSAEIEVVVVDDGSTDDTRSALNGYTNRIKYLHQTNAGMNAARNAGIRSSTGEFIAFLDSDDAWLPNKAELQLAVLERLPHVGFAFSNFFAWREDLRIPDGLGRWMVGDASIEGVARERHTAHELGIAGESFDVLVCDIYALSLRQPVVLPSTSVVRRSVIEALGPLPEDNWMCGDWEYFARASRQFGAAYLNTETTLNRSHNDSVRLMRRALKDRTMQRIESIRRTWREDREFASERAAEIDSVEAREWRVLYKCSCYDGDLRAAREHAREIERLSGALPMTLRMLGWLMHVPLSRPVVAALRRRVS